MTSLFKKERLVVCRFWIEIQVGQLTFCGSASFVCLILSYTILHPEWWRNLKENLNNSWKIYVWIVKISQRGIKTQQVHACGAFKKGKIWKNIRVIETKEKRDFRFNWKSFVLGAGLICTGIIIHDFGRECMNKNRKIYW